MSQRLELKLPYNTNLNDYLKKKYPQFVDYKILTKSLDARKAPRGKRPEYHYILEVVKKGEVFKKSEYKFDKVQAPKNPPIIIGAGPAGLFAALRFEEYGISTILIERGAKATKRMIHIGQYWKKGILNTESNVCYGEGGAGLFSDGKLITRIKSEHIKYVMDKLVDFGAPEETAYLSNPHLGSNKIRKIITDMTDYLEKQGHQIHCNKRVDKLLFEGEKVIGVELNDKTKLFSDHIILATGHSSKEIYTHLHDNQVAMESKNFAVGVRIEHPREVMDKLQHGQYAPELEAARYKLTYHNKETDKGTYSFCMCPGGYVLSSGTDQEGLVSNGMSNYARNSRWSNAALVVAVKKGEDFGENLFDGLKFQENIEKKAYQLSKKMASGKELPAMTLKEFMQGKLDETELPVTSSPSKIFKADITQLFPGTVVEHLRGSLEYFDQKIKGFIYDKAVLIAPETRTSAPFTILRDKLSLESISHKNLYPCGEGAGYAGGITSAAVDGVKVVESIVEKKLKILKG